MVRTLIGACSLLSGLRLFSGRHRSSRLDAEAAQPEPSRIFRVLSTDAELRDAVSRASRCERMAAERLWDRATRYEALVTPASPPRADEAAPVEQPSSGTVARRSMPPRTGVV